MKTSMLGNSPLLTLDAWKQGWVGGVEGGGSRETQMKPPVGQVTVEHKKDLMRHHMTSQKKDRERTSADDFRMKNKTYRVISQDDV